MSEQNRNGSASRNGHVSKPRAKPTRKVTRLSPSRRAPQPDQKWSINLWLDQFTERECGSVVEMLEWVLEQMAKERGKEPARLSGLEEFWKAVLRVSRQEVNKKTCNRKYKPFGEVATLDAKGWTREPAAKVRKAKSKSTPPKVIGGPPEHPEPQFGTRRWELRSSEE
jgi:hypothetical protein